MPSDLLTLALQPHEELQPHSDPSLVPMDLRWRDQLALAYLDAYPPGVAAENLDDARQDIDDTFAGEYGTLRNDASWVALQGGRAVGAVHVVERSIWDPELPGPFIIDLFVAPAAAGQGLGRSLIRAAVAACTQAGDTQLSLRIGAGTSAAAAHLYVGHGFMPLTQAR